MGYSGKVLRTARELIGGKKTYLSKERIAEDKKLKAKREAEAKAKAKAEARAKIKPRKGSRMYRGASGSDLAELEKRFGKKK